MQVPVKKKGALRVFAKLLPVVMGPRVRGDDTGARPHALKYAICVVVASSLPFGDHSSAF
ncbi:hypothetical protein ABIF68_000604 [Bradyrhizobium japonicum]|nr:hypothetical protein [Bradyrhizobium japonicum]MCW2329595.1 hypothetical protein [Bradyrhizobium japonicum]